MNGWIWFGIIVVVLIIVWLSLRKKKNNYGRINTSGGSLWDKVKSGCAGCFRRKEKW